MDNFGGRGGQGIVFSDDSKYVVKGLSEGDHIQLLKLSSPLAAHMGSGPSLLTQFLLHFSRLVNGQQEMFVVMKNVTPFGPYDAVFDLKGADDDDRVVSCSNHGTITRPSNSWGPASESAENILFVAHQAIAREAQFSITPSQHEYLTSLIQRDSNLLKSLNIMDYSLLVAVRCVAGYDTCDAGPRDSFDNSLIATVDAGRVIRYDISIIDFLQDWNLKKKMAYVAKQGIKSKSTVPPDEYQERFARVFESKFVPDAEEVGQQETIRTALANDLVRVASNQ